MLECQGISTNKLTMLGAQSFVRDETRRSGSDDLDGATAASNGSDFDLHCDAFLQLIDMADDAEPPASGLKLLQHRDRHRQARAIECAEAFVDEQAFDLDAAARRHAREPNARERG
jgi:hypothetical protein